MVRANGTRSARVIQVIETKAERGLGVEKDPVREITQYWSLEGKFLAERDDDTQFLCDLVAWESKRLAKIIEDLKGDEREDFISAIDEELDKCIKKLRNATKGYEVRTFITEYEELMFKKSDLVVREDLTREKVR